MLLLGVKVKHDGPDLIEALLSLVVGIGADVSLGVVVAEEHVVNGKEGGEGGLAEFPRHEDVGRSYEPPAVLTGETEDVGELEALHGGELVPLPSLHAAEAYHLVEPDLRPHAPAVPLVAVEQVEEPAHLGELIEVVPAGVVNDLEHIGEDAGVGVLQGMAVGGRETVPHRRELRGDAVLELAQLRLTEAFHLRPPLTCS